MGPLVIVIIHKLSVHLTHFIQAVEQVGIQYLSPVGTVKPFNIGVLRGLPGLYVLKINFIGLTP